jgi:hypothetical protein
MTDEQPQPKYGEMRPRPAYGEYATPEQQAAAMGKVYAPPPSTPPVLAPPPGAPAVPAPANAMRWNVLISAVLLGWGLFNVISELITPLDLTAPIKAFYTQQGLGTFTPTTLSSKLDVVINVANVVIFLLVLVLTYRRLRRGRAAAFIPLLGGVASAIVIFVCLAVLMYHDPAFIAYVSKNS